MSSNCFWNPSTSCKYLHDRLFTDKNQYVRATDVPLEGNLQEIKGRRHLLHPLLETVQGLKSRGKGEESLGIATTADTNHNCMNFALQ